MAISFSGISPYLSFSSQVGDIMVNCGTHESVSVELCNPGGSVVLSERFYAADGWVALHGIGDLCEEALRQAGLGFGVFELTAVAGADRASATLRLLYCDRFSQIDDCETFVRENFLTTHCVRRIPPRVSPSLFMFVKAGESVNWHVAICLRDKATGETKAASIRLQYTPETSTRVLSMECTWSDLIDVGNAKFPGADVEILQFTVYCGQRSVTFFVDESLSACDTFLFRNCFNVLESVTLPMQTTAKTTVEQSLAVVNGTARHYNRHASQSFEAETGPLTAQEAQWLEQFVTSHEVFRCEPSTLSGVPVDYVTEVPVLITDFSCEMQDGDDKLNTLKFTWRYADNRPPVRLTASPSYFTEQYSPTFS